MARLTAGLDGIDIADPVSSALAQARRRIGVKAAAELFNWFKAPLPVRRDGGAWYARSTARRCSYPAYPANLAAFGRGGGGNGPSGYPMLRC